MCLPSRCSSEGVREDSMKYVGMGMRPAPEDIVPVLFHKVHLGAWNAQLPAHVSDLMVVPVG